MAQVNTRSSARQVRIERWLGLNENPDGETRLKPGEAGVMRNWRITREGSLQVRPGYEALCTLVQGQPVLGLWSGAVAGQDHLLALCGGHVWDLSGTSAGWSAQDVGSVEGTHAFFFGFAQKVYLLTGAGYYCWDGDGSFAAVEGYVPLVAVASPPEGGGTLLEGVNKLTGKRRQRFSPDGEAKVFQLSETDIDQVLSVEGTDITWSADTAKGTVTFASAPAQGTDCLTVTWRKGEGDREKIEAMRFAEFYNGSNDTRVFLYGDGTNTALYSGLDEQGVPSAEYFPDLNVMAVDSANTPITAMVRHYDRLLTFKTDGAFSTAYSTLELADGSAAAAFYTAPLNREIGCAAPGQARLVDNDPFTLHGRSVYRWSLAGGAARDERNAKRVSHRVERTLAGFDLAECQLFDHEPGQELYLLWGDQALVYHYGIDVWYYYNSLPVSSMAGQGGEIYFGAPDGRLMHFDRSCRNDDLEPIDAWWESGAMDLGVDWQRKASGTVWVSLQPENQTRVQVTVQSDRRSQYPTRLLVSGFATLVNVDFAHWSFGTNRKPRVRRVRLRVKGAAYYKLIFASQSASATATVLAASIEARNMGKVR